MVVVVQRLCTNGLSSKIKKIEHSLRLSDPSSITVAFIVIILGPCLENERNLSPYLGFFVGGIHLLLMTINVPEHSFKRF